MRHRKKRGRLSRRASWRKATLKSLANDLFTYQRIETTKAKAKALRVYAEPLITLAKNNPDSVSARRLAYGKLCDRSVVKSLFDELGPLYKGVAGGYTRIMIAGNRKGDGAQRAIIELTKKTISDDELLGVEKEKAKEKAKKSKKKAKAGPKEPSGETKEQKGHVAPEVDIKEQEEHAVEDVKKEKAKTEQKKVTKRGFFKRFQRKSMG